MSGAFRGFSETDIKDLQNGLPLQKQTEQDTQVGKEVKFAPKNKKSIKPTVRFDENHLNDIIPIPEEAKLFKSAVVEPKENILIESMPITEIEVTTEVKSEETAQNHNISNTNLRETKLDIEDIQNRQKLIEEQNRKRKELIQKALVDKRKRTQEEAQKLNEIQKEFKRLDIVLSSDVKLLRKKIEFASIDYMEAQKRYMRIEKDFLDAKLALHKKLEKKELLTEHLSRIIEQNEERKAEKLTELLNKLEMCDVSTEECDDKITEH